MAEVDHSFQSLCWKIKNDGREYENKNRGVKRLQIPSFTFKHDFNKGFPAITNKDLYWKGIVSELLWFLRGQTNVWFLKKDKVAIWDKDAYNQYKRIVGKNDGELWNHLYMGIDADGNRTNPVDRADCKSFSLLTIEEFCKLIAEAPSYEFLVENYSCEDYVLGDVGKNYSYQWRNFGGITDQISVLVEDMRKDIMGSRLKVNAWNPSELDQTALPPCHSEFQVVGVPLTFRERVKLEYPNGYATNDGTQVNESLLDALGTPSFGFELHWNQRSVDTFLGLPFNIASYGLLGKILEHLTGFPLLGIEGTLKCVHFYDNQYEVVDTLLRRPFDTHGNCSLAKINLPTDFQEFLNSAKISDFALIGYTSDDALKVEMLAPKE